MFSLFDGDVKRYLNEVYRLVKDIVSDIFSSEDLYYVVIFGSVARPEDFIPYVSDTDVLVITKRPPHDRLYEFSESDIRIYIIPYTLNEFRDIDKAGGP